MGIFRWYYRVMRDSCRLDTEIGRKTYERYRRKLEGVMKDGRTDAKTTV